MFFRKNTDKSVWLEALKYTILFVCKIPNIPYPRERAPTTECSPTPMFWLNFLLWSKVYASYIVHNLLHYNNDAAASYLVWNYVNMPVGCG